MSYILDALKKSEQQRGNGKIPDVQTVHSSSLNYHSEKKTYWPYFLIAAILLNLIAIVYFILNKEPKSDINVENAVKIAEEKNTQDNISTFKVVPNSETNIPERTSKKSSTNNIQLTSAPVQEKPVSTKIKEQEISPPIKAAENDSSENILEYYDLSKSQRLQIPTITVSAHIYSSNPLQRSIVINNNFLEEGDYVLDDLILQEITMDGAIFEFNGTRFHYGVVSGWQ
ncbi:hypothetical protein MNBD_GAMMA05-2184 [hydrothermal vent metagenome]|uniref:Type II secretion system protein GspB C-terminal domain-containing protein n=1 Tax=hydrothermal vent metagenome TaxID=652676 RepID=A0A3B0X283_9ZZZZ